MFPEADPVIVHLNGTNGREYPCQILDIFKFGDREYGLLLKLSEEPGAETLLIMRLVRNGFPQGFLEIEDQHEFNRVLAHIESLIKGARDDSNPF